jgi:DNA-binding transcriptional ArsR family regulator
MRPLTISPRQCAKVFRVMGDDTRFRIVQILLGGEQCVTDLVRTLKTSQPHVSHHLRVLRQAGLVEGIREGQRISYRLLPAVQNRLAGVREEALDFGCCKISFSQTVLVQKH